VLGEPLVGVEGIPPEADKLPFGHGLIKAALYFTPPSFRVGAEGIEPSATVL